VPLDDLRELLSGEHPDDVRALLAHHRERIVERRADLERILARIDAVLHEGHGLLPYELEVVELAPAWVVGRHLATPRTDLDAAIEHALAELEDELAAAGAKATGRELILYSNPLQWYQGLDVEVCLPVAEGTAAACGARPLAGCRAARAVYRGPWDGIWQAYAALLAQIARRGLDVCGPVRESYLFDERDTDDPSRYLTEIAWPVQARVPADAATRAEAVTRDQAAL
jgi:effector-binding domain-containing protein